MPARRFPPPWSVEKTHARTSSFGIVAGKPSHKHYANAGTRKIVREKPLLNLIQN